MKQLLAICWEMPPLSGPRAVQVTRTLAALPELGWQSRVICFGARSDRYHQDHRVSVEALSRGHVTLVPVPSPEEWLLFRALWRVAPPLKHLPDEKRVWMPAALRAARREVQASPPAVIVSFAAPWTDHLIGLQLHRETGLPWVAHFSDPWVDSPYFPRHGLARRRARHWEREVIEAATCIVFVNARTRDRVMAKYAGALGNKTDVIPQAFDSAFRSVRVGGAAADRPMRMVYTGRFYDGVRTPVALLDAVAALNRRTPLAGRIAIEFAGADMSRYAAHAARAGIADLVSFHGRLPPDQARTLAADADVLLVIDAPAADGGLFLPSKLIEYLPMRRPIVGLTPAPGPAGELIRELGYPVVAPDDVRGIGGMLEWLLDQHASGRLVPSLQHDTVAARFTVEKTTRRFADVLERAVAAR